MPMPKKSKKKPDPKMLGTGLAGQAGIKLGGRGEQIEQAVMGTVKKEDKKKKKK